MSAQRLLYVITLICTWSLHASAQSPQPIADIVPQNQQFAPGSIYAPPNSNVPVLGAGADGGLLAPAPLPEPPPKIWSGSGEAGFNGATGNSELFNLRLGWNAKRQTESNILTTDFVYTYTRTEGLTSTNQAILNARDEILFGASPWSVFASSLLEYDELRAYDLRAGFYGGVGYTVVDDKTMTFKLRGGAGAVYETSTRSGSTLDSRWVPELILGYDFRYALNDRSSFLSVMDYYPRVDDLNNFRLRIRGGYEYVLDPDTGTVLRLGLQNRYDSDPGLNSKKNDLTYFATLGFKF
jgi:hypothetical protein